MAENELPNDLLRPGEAGKLVGKSPSCIVRWVQAGKIPGWRIAGQLHVSRADILGQVETVVPKDGQERPVPQQTVAQMRRETQRVLKRFGLLDPPKPRRRRQLPAHPDVAHYDDGSESSSPRDREKQSNRKRESEEPS